MICGSVGPRTTGVYALGGGSRARARSVMGRRVDGSMRILMSTFE
jgi:hypothetical protein